MAGRPRRSYETASSILGAMRSQWTRERMAEPSSEAVRPGMLRRSSHVIAERKPGVSICHRWMKLCHQMTQQVMQARRESQLDPPRCARASLVALRLRASFT